MSSITGTDELSGIARLPVTTSKLSWTCILICAGAVVLVLTNFSAPGREAPADSLDIISFLKFLVRFSLCLWMCWLIFARLRQSGMQRILLYCLPLLAFLVWAIASVLWSPLRFISLGQALGLSTVVLLLLVVADRSQEPGAGSAFLFSLAAAMTFYSAIIVAGMFLAPDRIGITRSDVGVFHPTNIGATASLGLILNLALHFLRQWKWSFAVLVISVPFHGLALLAANNRVSLALLIVIGLVLCVWRANRLALAAGTILISGAGLMLLLLDPQLESLQRFSAVGGSYVMRGQEGEQLTQVSGRMEMWQAMITSYLDSPVRGHGLFVSSATGSIDVWFKDDNHTAHNAVLQVLVSTGLIGFALVMAFLVRLVIDCALANSRDSQRTAISMLLGILLCWFFGWSITNESIFGPLQPETVCFYVVAGLFIGQRCRPTVGPAAATNLASDNQSRVSRPGASG